jgi:hypothetical protein
MKSIAYFRRAYWAMPMSMVLSVPLATYSQTHVYLAETPDYTWHAGCFGTASGNLAGFWDRHGLPDFYTGPTGGGLAPLRSDGANGSIRALWASQAGVDGRPANKPGHMDDYYIDYQATGPDPFRAAGRPEHAPDCTGDFIGLSQNKWTNSNQLNNECRGNIDAFSFVFWDKAGRRRANYYTTNASGVYIPDVASGLKEWARWRGYDADVFTQLSDFNPERTTTNGFTYEDVRREILAGFPVLCFLQPTSEFSRTLGDVSGVNPEIHGVMIYGLFSDPGSGIDKGVIIRTSWGSGDGVIMNWTLNNWLGLFPVRGVIGFHPRPKVRTISRGAGTITMAWDGPSAQLYDAISGVATDVHRYAVQQATQLNPANWKFVGTTNSTRSVTLPASAGTTTFYRVVLVP